MMFALRRTVIVDPGRIRKRDAWQMCGLRPFLYSRHPAAGSSTSHDFPHLSDRPELTKRPDLTDKGFGEASENLSTRVSV